MWSFRNWLTVSKDDIIIWVVIFHGNTFSTLYRKETRVKIVVGCKFSILFVSVFCKHTWPWLSANGLNGREILDIKFKIILFLSLLVTTFIHNNNMSSVKLIKIYILKLRRLTNIHTRFDFWNSYVEILLFQSGYILLDWIYLAATPLSTCFTDSNRRGRIVNDRYIDRFQRRSISVMTSQLTETSTVCFKADPG